MSTTNLNTINLATARRLKDPVTFATDDGRAYTSALRTEYINRSVKDLLLEKYLQYGDKAFRELFPEYVKTSGALTLTSGVVVKPSDAFIITSLVDSTGKISFYKLSQKQTEDVRRGIDPVIIPSATRPVFYEESGNIYTLGITSGTVTARYIVTPSDLNPISVAAGSGNYRSSGGVWTAATRLLSVTMATSFASTDVNKPIMFKASTNAIYFGIIESFVSTTSVIVRGDAIPAGNIASITDVLVSDVQDSTDLKINPYWNSEIINRAVVFGLQDAKNNVISA